MNHRTEWMSDKDYFGSDYPNNILLDDAKRRFEIQKKSLEGRDALIDGVFEKIVAQNHTNPLNQSRYDKKLSFDVTSEVRTGSIVEFDDKVWLVVSKIFDKQAYKVCSVLECSTTLTFHKDSISYSIPCVIESQVRLYSLGEESNKFFTTLKDEVIIRIPNNETSLMLDVNDVLKIGKWNYKVIDMNDIIENGLWILKVKTISKEETAPIPLPTPITDGVQIYGDGIITKSYTKDYKCVFIIGGNIVENLSEFYLTAEDGISPTNLAEIESQDFVLNTCKIKAKNFGTVILWVKNSDGSIISSPFTIQIKSIF